MMPQNFVFKQLGNPVILNVYNGKGLKQYTHWFLLFHLDILRIVWSFHLDMLGIGLIFTTSYFGVPYATLSATAS